MTPASRGEHLSQLAEPLRSQLDAAHKAREIGLAACRRTIRSASQSIRAVHRGERDKAAALVDECRDSLRQAQDAMAPFPQVAHAGFLHDAEKEYAEAVLTAALIDGGALAGADELRVGAAAWFNGLAEAASELRRHTLDIMRGGDLDRAENLLVAMEDVYDLLVTIDYPDALTGGLRRTTDALRAVLERTRADLTITVTQSRLQSAIESRLPRAGEK